MPIIETQKTRFKLFCCTSLFVACCSCTPIDKETISLENTSGSIYDEQWRPQFHFSPPEMWMNDPNGMVYYEGEYHLFYQHYPDSNVWGPMHWGHAVSSDLISWQNLPIALYPDELGYIFSGSAVIDWNNTSGFGTESNPAMVAIFTHHHPQKADNNDIDFQYQSIAYSLDKGRAWTKFEGNPVISNPGIRDFRDPKVIWLSEFNKWLMVLAVKDHISFYSSKDLKEWTFESGFGSDNGSHGGVWECPDIFKLKVEGSEEEKWVILLSVGSGGPYEGSATQYFVGDFDGNSFTPAMIDTTWLDYGKDNYAGVTWSDIPSDDGRRIFIGWMSNWQYAQIVPTMAWRSAMTLPRELILKEMENGGYRVISRPVNEIDAYIVKSQKQNDAAQETQDLPGSFLITVDDIVDEEFEIKISNDLQEQIVIRVNNDLIYFDRSKSGAVDFDENFSFNQEVRNSLGSIQKLEVYGDASSIEIFGNDGEIVLTNLVFPSKPYSSAIITGKATSKIESIKSIWSQ